MRARTTIASVALSLALALAALPVAAFADEALGDVDSPQAPKVAGAADEAGESQGAARGDADADGDAAPASTADGVQVSREGSAALKEGAAFALDGFSRAQKGSNREVDGVYRGYQYLVGDAADAGAFVQVVAADDYVVAYVPARAASALGIDVADPAVQADLKAYLIALDDVQAAGSVPLSRYDAWHVTAEPVFEVDGVRYEFDQAVGDNLYAFVIGADGSDLTDAENPRYLKPSFGDFARLVAPDAVSIVEAPTGLAALGEFFEDLDWSPLWVSLRTTGIAIVIIFVLGLLAAYFCLNISQRAKSIADVIFTIPMVLPPTVCGFILLYACGSNTPFGQFWIDVGFPLIFSPTACVIAAVVVAFPLMYRNALGAFEGLDRNMLDAARTLGWSNARIFVRLMLPLSWSSIAAGTVLAFARALGEFGATLFMAGNYVGITRTIPIAIYFEWMNGNDETAWFWVLVIIVFSFVVILFINLWSSHTTKYRRRLKEDR